MSEPTEFPPPQPVPAPLPARAAVPTLPASPPFAVQPYLVGGVIVALVLVLVYQQTQLSKLSTELAAVSDTVKGSDVRNRLDAADTGLKELNARLSYLDSKINAADRKAQLALNKLKAQEDNDFFGNLMKNIRHSLGMQ